MITYPELGKVGRLGNHLFQIAATIGCALDNGEEYGFPHWEYEKDFPLSGCFKDQLPDGPDYYQPRFQFDPIPYYPGLRLHGFFQSEQYFLTHESKIRKALTPLKAVSSNGLVEHRAGVASVHVRRGDYLQLQDKHPIQDMDYYKKAISKARDLGVKEFLVFSDDLSWCRAQDWGASCKVIDDMGAIDQLAQTIQCEHHILANSSFSWWGAWLAPKPTQVIIAPSKWFGVAHHAVFNTKDLFPAHWMVE